MTVIPVKVIKYINNNDNIKSQFFIYLSIKLQEQQKSGHFNLYKLVLLSNMFKK